VGFFTHTRIEGVLSLVFMRGGNDGRRRGFFWERDWCRQFFKDAKSHWLNPHGRWGIYGGN
jgi:hypothetical protein